MTGRRSSARLAAQSSPHSSQHSPPSQSKPAPSRKRKNDANGTSPSAKRGKKDAEPEQKTLEETIQNGSSAQPPAPEKVDVEMKDKAEEPQVEHANGNTTESKQEEETPPEVEVEAKNGVELNGAKAEGTQPNDETKPGESKEDTKADELKEDAKPTESNGNTKPAESEEPTKPVESSKDTKPSETNGDAVESGARNSDDVPSSILEKGVIYFFFRPRVSVDDPQDVNDVARSFLVMRPIPLDAKLGDGPIGDDKNCRLLALPKKVLPKSGKDRFVTFVEKCQTSFAELKDSFLTGSEYETKTQGTKHTAPVTPLAEGIYAITSTGRESHLAYIINIPSELGEVQKDFGLKQRGSFIASVKNPDQPPTGGQQNVPPGAKYPPEIIEEFRGLRWTPLVPRLLDYDQASFLIIGEDFDKATEPRPKDEREGNAPPSDEMEKLEGEDEIRIKHLKGDDAIFTDLHVTAKEIPEVRTTW